VLDEAINDDEEDDDDDEMLEEEKEEEEPMEERSYEQGERAIEAMAVVDIRGWERSLRSWIGRRKREVGCLGMER
jgi:hypothetical protein